jgi:hypothetical protein
MKGIILTLTVLASTSVFALTNWDIINIETYVGMDPQSIEDVLTKFPKILEGTEFTASDIEFAHVSDATLKYIGETICEEDDSRLTHQEITYMACPINKPTECILKFGDLLGSEDPCL